MEKAGRYEIVQEIGRGARGVVYKAFDPVIGRTVAIKTILSQGLAEGDFAAFRARFQFEAQSAGMLTHPNIVTVYDYGEEQGMLYLAMEYLEGKPLHELLKGQKMLPLATIVPIVEQVGSALDFAHSHHIIHRDVKPANIMILDSGPVKVMDFGAAKIAATTLATRTGQLLGTPNYMSPEQAKGRAVDGRSDLFSLGVVLYELLTGEKPFYGESVTTVIYKVVHETPIPPRELDPTIHPGLSSVVSKALAKSPDDRYQTCRELVDDLRNYRNLGAMAATSETAVLTPPLAGASGVAAGTFVRAVDSAESLPDAASAQEAPASTTVPAPPEEDELADTYEEEVSPEPSLLVWLLPVALLTLAVIGGLILYHRHAPPPAESNLSTSSSVPASGPNTESSPGSKVSPTPSPPPLTRETATSKPATSHPVAKTVFERPAKSVTLGALDIRSNIRGAKILIDGTLKDGWVTPYVAQVPAGSHTVSLLADGYAPNSQTVQVSEGTEQTVNFELRTTPGTLHIETVPAGLEVSVDGESWGNSPVTRTLPSGPHKLRVAGPPGRTDVVKTIEVPPNNFLPLKYSW